MFWRGECQKVRQIYNEVPVLLEFLSSRTIGSHKLVYIYYVAERRKKKISVAEPEKPQLLPTYVKRIVYFVYYRNRYTVVSVKEANKF